MVKYNFKRIQVVPNADEFKNIVLSQVQRKLPTVVHKSYNVVRIRQFYMRKVKYCQQVIYDRLSRIIEDFPLLDNIHPFYGDLMNVLYDKDHYKLALGQINIARHLVNNLGKDYVRLLKYGDSLYRCKQLKRAALGRMVKVLSQQKTSLAYLEEVRQHMSRLPSIDPDTRTLLICGFPNVGKSSFVNKITRANVEVHSYAFTTKSLYVGHCDYKYLRWQIIDSPGILDRPLEERNTIEMQAITALAHLQCCVVFFIDISEQCGHSIEDQVKLFESIKPLFTNKPLVLVLSKIDVRRPEDLTKEEQTLIDGVISSNPSSGKVQVVPLSSVAEEGIGRVKETACDQLLLHRAEFKLNSKGFENMKNRLHLAMPVPRDDIKREPIIPETVKSQEDDMGDGIAKERIDYVENEMHLYKFFDRNYQGIDWRRYYELEDDEWKFDTIPEIKDGENIADWIDTDLEHKFQSLLNEEDQRLVAYARKLEEDKNADWNDFEPLTDDEKLVVEKIRDALFLIGLNKKLNVRSNHSRPGRQQQRGPNRTIPALEKDLASVGIKTELVGARLRERAQARASRSRSRSVSTALNSAGEKRKRTTARIAEFMGSIKGDYPSKRAKLRSAALDRRATREWQREGKTSSADNKHYDMKPKHLFSGKRGFSADRR